MSSRSAWSSRQWQPRVSSRSRAAATRTRATHSRLVASQVSTPGSAVLPFSVSASRASECSRWSRSAALVRESAERSTPAPSVMIRWMVKRASAWLEGVRGDLRAGGRFGNARAEAAVRVGRGDVGGDALGD
ncbi:hypothetical protein SGLAM104S_00704 [Streptomyces glaucescens]